MVSPGQMASTDQQPLSESPEVSGTPDSSIEAALAEKGKHEVTSSEPQDETVPKRASILNEDQENANPESNEKVEMNEMSQTQDVEFIDPATGEAEAEAEAEDKKPAASEAAIVPEKLADDVMKPPLWRQVLYKIFPKLEKSE